MGAFQKVSTGSTLNLAGATSQGIGALYTYFLELRSREPLVNFNRQPERLKKFANEKFVMTGGLVALPALEYYRGIAQMNFVVLHRYEPGSWELKRPNTGTSLTVDYTLDAALDAARQLPSPSAGTSMANPGAVRHILVEGGGQSLDEALELVDRAHEELRAKRAPYRPIDLWLMVGAEPGRPQKDKGFRAATQIASLLDALQACAGEAVRVHVVTLDAFAKNQDLSVASQQPWKEYVKVRLQILGSGTFDPADAERSKKIADTINATPGKACQGLQRCLAAKRWNGKLEMWPGSSCQQ